MAETTPVICQCPRDHFVLRTRDQAYLDKMVAELGANIEVILNNVVYQVPRAYIAFHGMKGTQIAELAKLYNWESSSVGG